MPARDLIHDAVKNSLVKDGWTIMADPFPIEYDGVKLCTDQEAESVLIAQRGLQRMVVDAKKFLGYLPMKDLFAAVGEYQTCLVILKATLPRHRLFLAISDLVYNQLFSRRAIQVVLQRLGINFFAVRLDSEEIVQWISYRPTEI